MFFICGVAHPWSSSNLHPWKFVLLLPSLLSYFSCHHWFSSCGFINVMKEGYESSSARCQHHHDGRHDNSRMWSMQRRLSVSGSYRWYVGWAFAIIIFGRWRRGTIVVVQNPYATYVLIEGVYYVVDGGYTGLSVHFVCLRSATMALPVAILRWTPSSCCGRWLATTRRWTCPNTTDLGRS